MTNVNSVRSAPVSATTAAASAAAATETGASADAQPEVLTWKGDTASWWKRNDSTVLGGGLTAIAGGAIGIALLANSGHLTKGPIAGVVAGALALGAGVGAIVRAVSTSGDRVPAKPHAVDTPTLPEPAEVAAVPGASLPTGKVVGDGDGSYWATRTVTKYRTGSDGKLESYTEQERYVEYFSWNMRAQDPIGRREGYDTAAQALGDMPEGRAAALREQGGKVVPYELSSGSHWGDLDHLGVSDPSITMIVSPGGAVWEKRPAGHWDVTGSMGRIPAIDAVGQQVGEYEMRYQSNPRVTTEFQQSGARGYADLEHALGDMQARTGDQAVVKSGERYHVLDVSAEAVSRHSNNDGFVVAGKPQGLVAIEQQGGIWSPSGQWYVKPHTE